MRNSIFSMIIGALAFMFCTTSCSEDYLETAPTNQVATVTAFETVDNAWGTLNGIHRILYSQIFGSQPLGGQSGNMMLMDLMGEDVVLSTPSSSWLQSNYQWVDHRSPSHYTVRYNYLFYYVIIGNANMIIANVDDADGPEADKAFIKGQALAYRAWSYFQMVQLFGEAYEPDAANDGLGVTIITEPGTAPEPRNTVAEVYTQIHNDFEEALALLDGYQRGNDKSQLNSNVVQGMMARVALTQHNYTDAVTYAQAAREGFPLMSESDYLSGFNNYDVGEWMWSSRMIADQTNYFYSFFAHMSLNFSSSLIRGTPRLIFSSLYDQISDTDVRKQLWDPTGENVEDFPLPEATFSRFAYHSRKFRVANEGLSIGDIPYMRAAEMYLIEAEALARNNNDGQAADVLYEYVTERDPAYTRSINTGQDLIDEIMVQRRSELWGEGFRFYDLKRTGTPLDRRGGNHDASLTLKMQEPVGTLAWQWLIPLDEIQNSDGVVVQNPQGSSD